MMPRTDLLRMFGRSLRILAGIAVVCGLLSFRQQAAAAPPRPQSGERCDWTDQSYSDFYVPPELGEITPERLGEIVRAEHLLSMTNQEVAEVTGIESSPYGAEAYRVLYISQDRPGLFCVVSGLMIVPVGPVPEGGFPVVADGHPTVGLADACAPSSNPFRPLALLPWVAQGYIVSATDYQGLGTPGPHPYAVGVVAGHNLLDAARAGLRFCDTEHGVAPNGGNRIILEGHSQGGHAALFAHQEWPTYAPELNILGTIAFAPGSEPNLLAREMSASSYSTLTAPIALGMFAAAEYYGAPANLEGWLKEPYASELSLRVETDCLVSLGLWFGLKTSSVFPPQVLQSLKQGEWEKLEPWSTYMQQNTPGAFSSSVPVLIIHGDADPTVPVQASIWLSSRLCHHGTPTKLSIYPGGSHNAPLYGMAEALQWAADRLSGEAPTDVCFVPLRIYLPFAVR